MWGQASTGWESLDITCYAYSATHESYKDTLRGSDDLNVTLKRTPRRLRSYVYSLFTYWDFVLQSMIPS